MKYTEFIVTKKFNYSCDQAFLAILIILDFHFGNKFLNDMIHCAWLKFIYPEKATKFCEISTLLLSTVHTDKSKVEISQNFVAFSEYTNFTNEYKIRKK